MYVIQNFQINQAGRWAGGSSGARGHADIPDRENCTIMELTQKVIRQKMNSVITVISETVGWSQMGSPDWL